MVKAGAVVMALAMEEEEGIGEMESCRDSH